MERDQGWVSVPLPPCWATVWVLVVFFDLQLQLLLELSLGSYDKASSLYPSGLEVRRASLCCYPLGISSVP